MPRVMHVSGLVCLKLGLPLYTRQTHDSGALPKRGRCRAAIKPSLGRFRAMTSLAGAPRPHGEPVRTLSGVVWRALTSAASPPVVNPAVLTIEWAGESLAVPAGPRHDGVLAAGHPGSDARERAALVVGLLDAVPAAACGAQSDDTAFSLHFCIRRCAFIVASQGVHFLRNLFPASRSLCIAWWYIAAGAAFCRRQACEVARRLRMRCSMHDCPRRIRTC